MRVLVAGHSVGATIAGRLAATESIAGCVLLAGAAEDGETVMERQSESIAAAMTDMAPLRKRHFLRIQEHHRARLEHSASDVIKIDGDEMPARWFREYMANDPRADLRRVRCPVLAITGAHDVQVVPADALLFLSSHTTDPAWRAGAFRRAAFMRHGRP